jgi:hypothetical protein
VQYWIHDPLYEGTYIIGATVTALPCDKGIKQPYPLCHPWIRIGNSAFPEVAPNLAASEPCARVSENIAHLLEIRFVERWNLHIFLMRLTSL